MSENKNKSDKTVLELAFEIEELVKNRNNFVKSIKRPKTLIQTLKELNSIIEMYTFKTSIVEMIQGLMVNFHFNPESKFEGQMLHFCNYGDPGTGKSKASKILAKIFYSIGIDYNPNDDGENSVIEDNSNVNHDMEKISELSCLVNNLTSETSLAFEEFRVLKSINNKKIVSKVSGSKDYCSSPQPKSPNKHSTNWIDLDDSFKSINSSVKKVNDSVSNIYEELNSKYEYCETDSDEDEDDFNDNPNVNEDVYCVVCGRSELVAGFIGQTSIQAYDFLMLNRGKTVIIEEAYSLYEGDRDSFGKEALVQINRFMDENPKSIIIGFNGYMKELNDTIFTVQPGLKSRISKFFHMTPYTSSGLKLIFLEQLKIVNLKLDAQVQNSIDKFFEINKKQFKAFGRDTFRLIHCIKEIHNNNIYNLILNSIKSGKEKDVENCVSTSTLNSGMKKYLDLSFQYKK